MKRSGAGLALLVAVLKTLLFLTNVIGARFPITSLQVIQTELRTKISDRNREGSLPSLLSVKIMRTFLALVIAT